MRCLDDMRKGLQAVQRDAQAAAQETLGLPAMSAMPSAAALATAADDLAAAQARAHANLDEEAEALLQRRRDLERQIDSCDRSFHDQALQLGQGSGSAAGQEGLRQVAAGGGEAAATTLGTEAKEGARMSTADTGLAKGHAAMLAMLMAGGAFRTYVLPEEASGMLWMAEPGEQGGRRWGLAEAQDGAWALSPCKGVSLRDEQGRECGGTVLDALAEAAFSLSDGQRQAALVVRPAAAGDKAYRIIGFKGDDALTLGSEPDNMFCYRSRFVSRHHARIDYAGERFAVTDLGSSNGTFVNGQRIAPNSPVALEPGDVLEVLGLVMTFGYRFVSVNNPGGLLNVADSPNIVPFEQPPYDPPEEGALEADQEPECFYPAPRFKRDVVRSAFSVDAPPAPEKPDDTPVAMKIGPSMVMALAAVFSGAMMFLRMQQSGGSVLSAAPMLVMAVALVCGSVLWPILSRRYQARRTRLAEAGRRRAYEAYLDRIRGLIAQEVALQREVLQENRVTVDECLRRALETDPHLMDRTPAHDDFLQLRLGTGTVPLEADIRYPDEHFAVEQDPLAEVVYKLAREPKEVPEAPVAVDLAANPVVGVAGDPACVRELAFGLVAQIACLHSYEDVKLAVLCDSAQADEWGWAAALPHAFSDDKAARYLATTLEDAAEMGLVLGAVAEGRREAAKDGRARALPHYVVICASRVLAAKSELTQSLAKEPAPGFTLVCLAKERRDLPKQCSTIVEVPAKDKGAVRSAGDASGRSLAFYPDSFAALGECRRLSEALNRVQLDVAAVREALPDSLGFLEMYGAANVSQLNVRARWAEGKASETLACRIGVDAQGEPFMLNLHERFHGPHGLIAGTTGSGKSEFIVTWILSMCAEYSPEEAAFVLIDYKGGGLAGAFDGEVRLPHLAGTVTNLDGAAIARSLASIRAELRRRQALMAAARPAAGGGNVDVYRYQALYREGKVAEPCPHLFVVADEFAELKAQEPEFMDELVSAARIGRSLGVHLVLATQRPSGVVSDQIWSNARFKACLKVADAADSKEMVRRPDAAALSQAGRFYLLVGYNEQFSLGQAAWAGAPYEPDAPQGDARGRSVELVAASGRVLASAAPARKGATKQAVPQLSAVLGHLAECAAAEGMSARRLWLDPLPARIPLAEVRACPDAPASEPFCLEPVVGMLDDPAAQEQRPLSLPLTREGNAVVYGSADSGAEALLATMLADLLQTHDAAHLNAYVMDFGSEALTAFAGAPQVGDVVVAGEGEKVSRLFDMLERETARRRKLVASYGGSFSECARREGGMPALLLVVNGPAVFTELYERFEPRLVTLSREGARTGLWVVLCATATQDVRMRLRTNFKLALACGLASSNEYLNVLGSLRGVVPPKGYARGLVRQGEEVYEFQGALVAGPDEDPYGKAQELCASLCAPGAPQAAGIPVLPDTVTPEVLAAFERRPLMPAIGIFEDDLSPARLDFEERALERILFPRAKDGTGFVRSVMGYLMYEGLADVALLDAARLFPALPGICSVETQDDAEAAAALSMLLGRDSAEDRANVVVFVSGIAGLLTRADPALVVSVRNGLKRLRPHDGLCLVLFDTANDATYTLEDWFKSQSSNKDGIWIGHGLDSQSAVQVSYSVGERIDPEVKAPRGYTVNGGKMRKARFLSRPDEERSR